MPTSDELRALADRVEALTGPDRGIDRGIWLSVFERPRPGDKLDKDMVGRWPRFTASLDAAMTLVPDKHFIAIVQDGDGKGFQAMCQIEGDAPVWTLAATPALALTAAALRARATGADHG